MERKIGGTKGLFPDPAQAISGNGATQLQGCSASAMGPSWLWGVWGSHETLIKVQELPSAPSPKTISLDSRKIQADLRRSPFQAVMSSEEQSSCPTADGHVGKKQNPNHPSIPRASETYWAHLCGQAAEHWC